MARASARFKRTFQASVSSGDAMPGRYCAGVLSGCLILAIQAVVLSGCFKRLFQAYVAAGGGRGSRARGLGNIYWIPPPPKNCPMAKVLDSSPRNDTSGH